MNFIRTNIKEILSFVFLLFVFLILGRLLQWLDPAAGTIDSGWLQVLVAGLVKATFGLFGCWLLLETGFPSLRDWVARKGFKTDFEAVSSALRLQWFCLLFIALLAFIAVCFANS